MPLLFDQLPITPAYPASKAPSSNKVGNLTWMLVSINLLIDAIALSIDSSDSAIADLQANFSVLEDLVQQYGFQNQGIPPDVQAALDTLTQAVSTLTFNYGLANQAIVEVSTELQTVGQDVESQGSAIAALNSSQAAQDQIINSLGTEQAAQGSAIAALQLPIYQWPINPDSWAIYAGDASDLSTNAGKILIADYGQNLQGIYGLDPSKASGFTGLALVQDTPGPFNPYLSVRSPIFEVQAGELWELGAFIGGQIQGISTNAPAAQIATYLYGFQTPPTSDGNSLCIAGVDRDFVNGWSQPASNTLLSNANKNAFQKWAFCVSATVRAGVSGPTVFWADSYFTAESAATQGQIAIFGMFARRIA